MQKLLKKMPLTVVLLCGAFQMAAQGTGSTPDEAMRKLQIRMDALRGQMAQIQAELDAMRGQNKFSDAIKDVKPVPESLQTGTIERTLPPLPASVHLSPEQQRAAVGKQIADYETFSEDPEAAARLYNAPLEATYPGFFVLPGTQTILRINGRLKTDFIFDPRPAGVEDAFITSSTPIPQDSSTNSFNVSIRQSRLSADFRVPVRSWGTARMFMQFDFFGSNGATTPRLRHAYAQISNILVGQTFTNFMDPDATPDTVDFQGPNSRLSVRSPQARYSFLIGKGMSGSVSVEQPNSDIRFSQNGSAAVPISRYVNDTGGLGLDAAPRTETDLTLKALPLFAPYFGYQHHWTRTARSTATFGFVQLQNTAFQPGNTFHKSTYSSVNVIWNAMGGLDFGAEFLYGWVEQKDRAKANAPRIQFSGRYTFVKLHNANPSNM